MHTSSRVSRAVRNSLVLGTAAAAALGLAGCKAVPSFNLDSSASGITAPAPGSGGPTGISTQPGSETGAPGSSAGTGTSGTAAHKTAGTGGSSTGSGPANGQPTSGGQQPLPGAPAPHAGGPVLIGSVAGGYQQALAGTGVQLADHEYAFFSSKVPQNGQMITVSAGNTPWRQVATAGPGSALYGQIVSWAQTIKTRGPIMVAYNHEPEGHDRLTLGTPQDFIDAYRHVETIFDQQGATNVMWTWQMTAYAFSANPSSPQYAAKWYPGDQWIDNVGADAYNWIGCGSMTGNNYRELQQIGDPVLAFARAHNKLASFPEFGDEASPNRVQWLNNAHQYFVQNEDILTAAFYFNRPPTIAANAACKWPLTTSAEYGALRAMAQDTAHFAV